MTRDTSGSIRTPRDTAAQKAYNVFLSPPALPWRSLIVALIALAFVLLVVVLVLFD